VGGAVGTGVLGRFGRAAAGCGVARGAGVGRVGVGGVGGAMLGALDRAGGTDGARTGPLAGAGEVVSRGTDGIRPDPLGGGSGRRDDGSSPSLVSGPDAGSDGSRVT